MGGDHSLAVQELDQVITPHLLGHEEQGLVVDQVERAQVLHQTRTLGSFGDEVYQLGDVAIDSQLLIPDLDMTILLYVFLGELLDLFGPSG